MRNEKTRLEWVIGHDKFIQQLMKYDNPMSMNEYIVEITGTFRKTLVIEAPNEDEAEMAVEDIDFKIESDDIIDYEIDDVYRE